MTKPKGGMGLILSAAYSANELDVCVEWPTPGTVSFLARGRLSISHAYMLIRLFRYRSIEI